MRYVVYYGDYRMKFETVAGQLMASPVAHLYQATDFASAAEAMSRAIAQFGDEAMACVEVKPVDIRASAAPVKTDELQPTLL